MALKVLIIDDDRSVRHIVASGLNGYCDIVVVPAADGDIGLDLLESEKPTVVLLDVFLPHPEYSKQHFVCILNPSQDNVELTKKLIIEAHSTAASRLQRRTSKGSSE